MMKLEDWTDSACKAMGASSVVKANRMVKATGVAFQNPKSYLIKEGQVVGRTGYFSDYTGRMMDEDKARRNDIVFLNGNEIVVACAPKDAFDIVRKVEGLDT
jgi:hypothetical protein